MFWHFAEAYQLDFFLRCWLAPIPFFETNHFGGFLHLCWTEIQFTALPADCCGGSHGKKIQVTDVNHNPASILTIFGVFFFSNKQIHQFTGASVYRATGSSAVVVHFYMIISIITVSHVISFHMTTFMFFISSTLGKKSIGVKFNVNKQSV